MLAREGGRCVYVVLELDDATYLITAYPKSKKSDLSDEDKKAIKRRGTRG